MPRPFPGLLLLLALSAPVGALAAVSGDYSNLCRSARSGDLNGMTLSLSGAAAQLSVALRICEGVCWNARIGDVRLEGDRLTFTAEERALNDHNEISKQMFYRFTARLADDTASVSANMVYGPQTLRRTGASGPAAAPSCR